MMAEVLPPTLDGLRGISPRALGHLLHQARNQLGRPPSTDRRRPPTIRLVIITRGLRRDCDPRRLQYGDAMMFLGAAIQFGTEGARSSDKRCPFVEGLACPEGCPNNRRLD